MKLRKIFLSISSFLMVFFAMTFTACTPEYTRQQSQELAGQARLLDSIDVERQNQRLLSHQAQICLVSADGGDEAGATLLRAIQAGFAGYFAAVSVVGESIDYLRAVSSAPCPGASYLFYIQASPNAACHTGETCATPERFNITVVSVGDQGLVDRIHVSIKKSFLPLRVNESERKQKAFEELALVLTGGK